MNQISIASSPPFLFLVSGALVEVCGVDTHEENVNLGGQGGDFYFASIAFVMFEFAARVCIIFVTINTD